MVSLERQTITATTLARIPRRPGPGAVAVRCRCSQLLGIVDGDWFFFQRHGRAVTCSVGCEVRCEECGRYTKIDKPTV